ncbi:serine hydrolase [Luteimonas viscosa]|uniref:Beta-lactamase n=1 Tax=Luteimonas viscosa TaxID=1132694 RepID=A0A5D4XMY8_9GAMM|nr:serine hydrolase [Luteimonas viscosa]TYT25325.1 serine hydrolase [Luteimonas viscosa]
MKTFVTGLAAATCLILAGGTGTAHAASTTDATLQAVVDRRLASDRTGACMAVAIVEQGTVARTYRCADPRDAGRIGPDTAFEIGSVSKTMAAVLLADLIERGQASLDDPLSDYLPEGTKVPSFEGEPILLRHVVTHTSGLPALPSRMQTAAADVANPYAELTEADLLASLGDATLAAAPGTRFEYSNFASMVLSYAIARRAGMDFESLLKRRLFAPLGMRHAYVDDPPAGVRAATGHTPNTQAALSWDFATNLAGVGGVRATLDDMVRYVQGNLGFAETAITPALERAQERISEQPPMAMNWMLAPVAGRTVHLHEGGTGGFSAFVSIDRERRRGVVILSDTTWNSIGSLGSLGMHLVDPSLPLGKPRKLASPPAALLEALAGEYRMPPFPQVSLRQRDGKLFGQVTGQEEFGLAYDDAGDFFPTVVDAILRPQKKANGEYGFQWMQMGGVFAATRISDDAGPSAAPSLSEAELAAYAGEYPLMPNFALTVRVRDGKLRAQATGQGEFPLEARGKDTFEAAAYGIELVFKRDGKGEVASLDLHQGGQVLSGPRN